MAIVKLSNLTPLGHSDSDTIPQCLQFFQGRGFPHGVFPLRQMTPSTPHSLDGSGLSVAVRISINLLLLKRVGDLYSHW